MLIFQNVASHQTSYYVSIYWDLHLCERLVTSRVHATLQLALSVRRAVGPLVGLSVHQTLLFLLFRRLWAVIALLHLPKCMVCLFHYLGSRVSGLV